jgi:hypothetical protein
MDEIPKPDDVTAERIRRKHLPDSIHTSLLKAAVLITVWELLKHEVRDAPYRKLFPRSNEEGGEYFDAQLTGRFVVTQRYREAVLASDKDPYRAAARWLVNQGALSEEEFEELLGLRDYRNKVVHELVSFLIDIECEVDARKFARCTELLEKVARWRIADEAPQGAVPMITLIPRLLAEIFGSLGQSQHPE